MLDDFNIQVACTVCTDAAATFGIVHSRDFGKTRHIDVQYLWIQQHVVEERLHVAKVRADSNPADMLTKHLRAETVAAHATGRQSLERPVAHGSVGDAGR